MAEEASTPRWSVVSSSDSAIDTDFEGEERLAFHDREEVPKDPTSPPHRGRLFPVNRQDLLARYLNQSITEKECHTITSDKSHRLGPDWKKLGRELGIPEAMIESSAQKENDVERAHAMLIDFCRDQGKNVKIKRLVESLKKIGRTDITEKLLEEHEVSNQKPIEGLYEEMTINDKNVGKVTICNKDGQIFILYPAGAEFERDLERMQQGVINDGRSVRSHIQRLLVTSRWTRTLTNQDNYREDDAQLSQHNRTQSESTRKPPRVPDLARRPSSAIDPLCTVNRPVNSISARAVPNTQHDTTEENECLSMGQMSGQNTQESINTQPHP